MQKITPFLWFDGKAEEAMEFYTSVFENSRVISVMRYGDAGGQGRRGGDARDVRAFRELQDASGGG
jgi:predicted 3-demethylubiquinone-9 3-methyltransferase (glyoxalase superfamily)